MNEEDNSNTIMLASSVKGCLFICGYDQQLWGAFRIVLLKWEFYMIFHRHVTSFKWIVRQQ